MWRTTSCNCPTCRLAKNKKFIGWMEGNVKNDGFTHEQTPDAATIPKSNARNIGLMLLWPALWIETMLSLFRKLPRVLGDTKMKINSKMDRWRHCNNTNRWRDRINCGRCGRAILRRANQGTWFKFSKGIIQAKLWKDAAFMILSGTFVHWRQEKTASLRLSRIMRARQ